MQHIIVWHIDNLKLSHVDENVNYKFLIWLSGKYMDYRFGRVKATQGTKHDYLGMILDYLAPGTLKMDMTNYKKEKI